MKRVLLILFIVSITVVPVTGQEEFFTEGTYITPMFEFLDLYIDGSINPILVNLTKDFDYVTTIYWHCDITDAVTDYDDWGTGSALTNGTQAYYDEQTIGQVFKNTGDLLEFADWYNILADEQNPKTVHLTGWQTVSGLGYPNGLKIKEGHNFTIAVRDDNTAGIIEFEVKIAGFRVIELNRELQYSFVEDVMDADNPVEFFLMFFIVPLVMVLTGWDVADPVIFGIGAIWLTFYVVATIGIVRKVFGDL